MAGLAQNVTLDTVDSTNAEALRACARRRARAALDRGAAADGGTRAARRAWVSPPGNLYATLLLIDPAPPAAAPQLGFVAGCRAARRRCGDARRSRAAFALKWPNDMLSADARSPAS